MIAYLQEQVKEKTAEIAATKARCEKREMIWLYKNVVFVLVLFVFGLVSGKLFM